MAKLSYLLAFLTTTSIFHDVISKSTVKHLRTKNGEFEDQLETLIHIQIQDQPNDASWQKAQEEDREDIESYEYEYAYTVEAQADLITSLPGLNFTPTFRQFSGYIPVSPTRNIHYWYIESSNDPANDPVVFWTNGGPGCSGLLGLGTEFGPFLFEKNGVLSYNPNTWNQVANILYVEQPAGVGFSTFTNPEDQYVGDERAAVDNYELIVNFFRRFPERATNEFYIASESYGGHYIPHLAKEILDRNINISNSDGDGDGDGDGDLERSESASESEPLINFRGFLVGNPYVDPFSNDMTMIQTYYMHGLIAGPLYRDWQAKCTNLDTYNEEICSLLVDSMFSETGEGINPYALDFPICTEPDINNDYSPSGSSGEDGIGEFGFSRDDAEEIVTPISASFARRRMSSSQSSRLLKFRLSSSGITPPFLPQQDKYHPCADDHFFAYLNRDDVKEALHVDVGIEWSMCSDDIEYSDRDSNTPQMYLYEELIERAREDGSNFKMMVFSGDDDSVCSTASTQYWIYDVGAEVKDEHLWNAWKYNNQTAGYVTEFDLGETDSSFLFVTVHGAGHEVPAYRPSEALAMFKSFFSGEWDIEDKHLLSH